MEAPFQDYINVRGRVEPAYLTYLDAVEGGIVERILREEGAITDNNYPCFIGNTPVHRGGNRWVYQNNNPSNGCDREQHLCGSGHAWEAACNRVMKDRYCANGKKGFLGWP